MNHSLVFNPFMGVQIAAVAQTFVMLYLHITGNSWSSRLKDEENCTLISTLIRSFFLGLMGTIGLLLLDISIPWLLSAWSYSDWRYHLPSVLLTLYVAIQMLFGFYYGKATIFESTNLLIGSLGFLWFFHIYLPEFQVMGPKLEEYGPKVLGVILVMLIIGKAAGSYCNRGERKTWAWNGWIKTQTWQRIYTPHLNFVVWVLTCTQAILSYLGTSLFEIV